MNESELKTKVNEYRAQVEKRNREIDSILGQLHILQREANKLRALRDDGNEKCKKLSAEAKKLRERRDSLNSKIAGLKKERSKLMEKVKGLSGDIKNSKEKRDSLNKSARGTDTSLAKLYEKSLSTLLNEDIPLKREERLFEAIFEMQERLKSAKEATGLHLKVVSTYEDLKGLNLNADEISAEIRKLADESEKYHLEAISIYDNIDKMRKESDEAHKQLLEKYDSMNPLRDRITALKEEIGKIQDEMAPFGEELDGIRVRKDEERKAQLAMEAKEKLKSSKRISFDDFKAIIEGGIGVKDEGEKPSGS